MGTIVDNSIKEAAKTLYRLRYSTSQIGMLLKLSPQTIRTYVNKNWEEAKLGHRLSSHYPLTWEEVLEAMEQFPTFNLRELSRHLNVSHSFLSKHFNDKGIFRKWDAAKIKEFLC